MDYTQPTYIRKLRILYLYSHSIINGTSKPLSRIELISVSNISTVRFTVICIRYPKLAFSIYRHVSRTIDSQLHLPLQDRSVSIGTNRWQRFSCPLIVQYLSRTVDSARFQFVDFLANQITHCAVATPALVPHPSQGWMGGIHEVNYPHIKLRRMLTVETPGVLLQGSLPRHRHRQNQGVQRRMVEALTYQLAGRKQYARSFRWQSPRVAQLARRAAFVTSGRAGRTAAESFPPMPSRWHRDGR